MIGRSCLSRRDILYKGLSIIILFVHTIRQNSGSVSEKCCPGRGCNG